MGCVDIFKSLVMCNSDIVDSSFCNGQDCVLLVQYILDGISTLGYTSSAAQYGSTVLVHSPINRQAVGAVNRYTALENISRQ